VLAIIHILSIQTFGSFINNLLALCSEIFVQNNWSKSLKPSPSAEKLVD